MRLYEIWQHTLERHAGRIAVHGPTPLRFLDLQKALDAQPRLLPRSLHPARASDGLLHFLIQTLRAWRDDAILCPVETETPALPPAESIPSHICHLKFTSGSTGPPRCVMFRGSQLVADVAHIRSAMQLNPEHPNLSAISPAHSYGFSNLTLPLLLQGHPLILLPDALPASVLASTKNLPPITLPAVPALWRAWHQSGILPQLPISLAISAGAPLPLDLEQDIHQSCGLKIHNFLGSSECGAIAFDKDDTPRDSASFAGHQISGIELALDDYQCLSVASPAVAEGYINATAEETQRLGHGRFTTTDLARLGPGAAVHLLGRASDTINLAGRKLHPAEIEALLLQHPNVHHCVVFGVPSNDPVRCEETVACLHLTASLSTPQLRAWLGERLPPWKRPRHYWSCPDLLPNERGKIPRHHWRQRWLEQQRQVTNDNT